MIFIYLFPNGTNLDENCTFDQDQDLFPGRAYLFPCLPYFRFVVGAPPPTSATVTLTQWDNAAAGSFVISVNLHSVTHALLHLPFA